MDKIHQPETVVISNSALGNGQMNNLHDIVFVKPKSFNPGKNNKIAAELEKIN